MCPLAIGLRKMDQRHFLPHKGSWRCAVCDSYWGRTWRSCRKCRAQITRALALRRMLGDELDKAVLAFIVLRRTQPPDCLSDLPSRCRCIFCRSPPGTPTVFNRRSRHKMADRWAWLVTRMGLSLSTRTSCTYAEPNSRALDQERSRRKMRGRAIAFLIAVFRRRWTH